MTRFFKFNNILSFSLIFILISSLAIPFLPFEVEAQSVQLEQATRDKLEKELADLEKELAKITTQLQNQQGESASLKRDVAILNTKINQAKTDIKAKNVLIQKLGGEINTKNKTIYSLSEKIERERDSLAQLIRKSYELQDETSFVHVLMSSQTLSDFYKDLDDFGSIKDSIADSLGIVRVNKSQVEVEKTELVKKQDEQENAKAKLEAAQRAVEASQKERANVLKISQGKESEYAKVKAEKEKRKAQILSALFDLRDGDVDINFEKALAYAKAAEKMTGVRPAFLLAILTQETNLGKNVGTCIITDLETGQTKNINSGKVYSNGIHPTRDLPLLHTIVTKLGKNPLTTRVSCPLSVGYGGAMGPAQFIPSTWAYMEKKVAAATGKALPDPWNPRDAFFASSVYLGDLNADAGTYTAEKNAACKYYSGRSCSGSNTFYGNSVMAIAEKLQANIDLIDGN